MTSSTATAGIECAGGALRSEATMTQNAAIRQYLLTHGEIDRPTALRLCDCDRLGARIWDLRNDPDDPLDIETVRKIKTNRYGNTTTYAVYRLRKGTECGTTVT